MFQFSIFSGVKPTPTGTITLQRLLARITSDKHAYALQVKRLRLVPNKKERNALKNKLDAVTFSGIFKKHRSKATVSEHTGLLCFDLDNLTPEQLNGIPDQLQADPYIFCHFVSPSGNGLKFLLQIPQFDSADPAAINEHHETWWRAARNYLTITLHITIDESCKNVDRLCYVSYDPAAYFCPTKEIFSALEQYSKPLETPAVNSQPASDITKPKTTTPYRKLETPNSKLETSDFDQVHRFTDNIRSYGEGHRNEYINQFVINCKTRGIAKEATAAYCLNHFSDYVQEHGEQDIFRIVDSVYNNNAFEFGKYAPKQKPAPARKASRQPAPTGPATNQPKPNIAANYNTDTLFWYEVEKKGSTKENPEYEVKFSYDAGIDFLTNNGFYKLPMPGNKYQFIRVKNNIVSIVDERLIREFMLGFLETDRNEYRAVREMFRRGAKQYGATHYLEGLSYYKPVFMRDTRDVAYIYFRNCFAKITAQGITTHPYTQLQGCIWEKQIVDFDFTAAPTTGNNAAAGYYQRFIYYAILGRADNLEAEHLTDTDKQKIASVLTATGYQLHRYKDPANSRSVIAVDKSKRVGKQNNGRSGKSLHGKAIGKVVPRCVIDGRNFKWDAPYPFEKLNLDHAILHLDDVSKNFDFERLYSLTTEEFTYTKKYIDAITLPYEDSPKVYITTNFSLRAKGDSAIARMHIIEFSNYFTASHTPQKEFGHLFFSDWDTAEWNSFYNFMLGCISLYLNKGLVEFPLENYAENQMIDVCGEEFVAFMDEVVRVGHEHRTQVKELFLQFKDASGNDWLKQNTFSMWVKEHYAPNRGLLVNAHKPDGRDRSNGLDYWTFTKEEGARNNE